MNRYLSRRRLLALALTPLAASPLLACSDDEPPSASEPASAATAAFTETREPAPTPSPVPTATPTPIIVAAGRQERTLLGGTPSETAAVIIGSGQAGPVALVLGGVHGNEPGGWQAAEQLAAQEPPARGALLVIPRANVVATQLFERTTEDLGDLNRLYPGKPDGLPMEQMAAAIVALAREFQVELVIDMHESWAFYRDRTETQGGTAYLGQTISTDPTGDGVSFGEAITAAVNCRILHPWEEMTFRMWPDRRRLSAGSDFGPGSGRGGSSLSLPRYVPGLTAFLVEMGQQQPIERRVALHLDVANEALRRRGLYDA